MHRNATKLLVHTSSGLCLFPITQSQNTFKECTCLLKVRYALLWYSSEGWWWDPDNVVEAGTKLEWTRRNHAEHSGLKATQITFVICPKYHIYDSTKALKRLPTSFDFDRVGLLDLPSTRLRRVGILIYFECLRSCVFFFPSLWPW